MCSAIAPEPNSSKITRSMPSAYTSNGTGRCCHRKSAPILLTMLAIGRIRWMTNGIALMSAAESRLVRSAGLPNQPIEPSAWTPIVCGWLASGPACSARRRRRRIERRPRISLPLAYVEGRVRERHRSPSILSKSSCWADMPTKPASSASSSIDSMRACSRRVGRTSLRVARSRPIVAVRMSEWPMNAARFGPRGSDSSAPTYCSAVLQSLCSSTARITCWRGIASTRPKRSPASTPPTWTVESEHEPSSNVVTPCRTDSGRPGPSSTSMS